MNYDEKETICRQGDTNKVYWQRVTAINMTKKT